MEKVTITGAKGFVGKHLIKRLENYATIPHDFLDEYNPETLEKMIYLASYGNLFHQSDAKETIKANLLQPYRIATDTYYNSDFTSFIYVSTSSVNLPSQTIYSASKWACEQLLMAYDGPFAIVRPYSITGVGEQSEHLIPTLIRAAYSGEVVPFVPEPVHDFIDVEDFVDALLFISERSLRGVFEVGRGEPISNADVLWAVETITGKTINIKQVDSLRPYDSKNWFCKDDSLSDLGWKPKKKFIQTITEMVEAYDKS